MKLLKWWENHIPGGVGIHQSQEEVSRKYRSNTRELKRKRKVKVKSSVMSDSSQPHGLQPTRILRPWVAEIYSSSPKSVFLFFLVSISVWHLFSSENLTDTNGEKRTPVVLQMPSQCPQSEESGFAKRQEGCQGQRQTPHPLWGKGDGENKEIRRGPCINIIWTFKTAKKWRLLNNE